MSSEYTNELPLSARDGLNNGSIPDRRGDDRVVSAFRDGGKLEAPSVTELNLFHMTQRREQTQTRVAEAAREMERLRAQREELERERQRLETLDRRQVKYETEYAELREGLTYRMELLRKMDLEASRRAELFAAVRRRFEEMMLEVDRIRDQEWGEDRYDEEVNRALAVFEDIEREYSRAWSRVEAVSGEAMTFRPEACAVARDTVGHQASLAAPRRLVDWVWVGMAFSLPSILVMLALFALARRLWGGSD